MRAGPRLQALADLLTLALADTRPVDRILRHWGQQNRYAGSKDRRYLADRLFAILRHYRALCERLERDDALLVVMLAEIVLEQAEPHDVLHAADGSPHAPAPLPDDARIALLKAAGRAPKPRAAQLSLPDWMLSEVEAALGDAHEATLTAMLERAPVDVRVNTLKAELPVALAALADEGIGAYRHPLVEGALRVGRAPRLTQGACFTDGWIEVQDAGAQQAALLCGAKPDMRVLDYCAGAGGKALALAAQMNNQGADMGA